ncbi:MAG: hypothetical protein ACOX2F_04890 [bacterium]
MKRLFLAIVFFALAMFIASCGSDDSNSCDDGDKKCSGDVFKWCVEGEWVERDCAKEGKTCSTDGCVAKDNTGGDTGNNGDTGNAGDTGDTGDTGNNGDTGDTSGSTGASCSEIYQCMIGCGQDGACQQACYEAGSTEGKQKIEALINCLNNCSDKSGGSDDAFQECANSECANQIAECGLGGGQPGDTSYKTPYGNANLNFSINYLLTNETQLEQNMVVMDYFAKGSLGNGSIQAPGAEGAFSYALYYQDAQGDGIQVVQQPFINQGQTPLNPVAFFIVPANSAPGNISVGLTQEDVGQFFVAETGSDGQISCMHGFGIGNITINSVNAAAGGAGNISFSGALELYSPKNAPIYGGDISNDLGVVTCPPM